MRQYFGFAETGMITLAALFAACIEFATPTAASCDEVLKVAVGAPNNWDSSLPDVGQRAGIFKKHGLILEILYTNGGGETMQAVISGSADPVGGYDRSR